ncbi:hypothetical protein Hanom_Chr09g00812071 [Helianthus anomalus]
MPSWRRRRPRLLQQWRNAVKELEEANLGRTNAVKALEEANLVYATLEENVRKDLQARNATLVDVNRCLVEAKSRGVKVEE